MRDRLSTCLVVVVALHAAVLAWASHPLDGQAQAQARPGHAVQVRLLSQGAGESISNQLIPTAEPALSESDTNVASPSVSGDPALGPTNASVRDGDSQVDLAGYVPRRWLTVPPKAVAPVILPFPDSFDERSRYTVVLNLYIEADGRVGRVEFEGVRLPDVLERAARVTFENARFTPGQVNGRIVKSLIKVEVDFDNLGRG